MFIFEDAYIYLSGDTGTHNMKDHLRNKYVYTNGIWSKYVIEICGEFGKHLGDFFSKVLNIFIIFISKKCNYITSICII